MKLFVSKQVTRDGISRKRWHTRKVLNLHKGTSKDILLYKMLKDTFKRIFFIGIRIVIIYWKMFWFGSLNKTIKRPNFQ